MYRAVLAGTAGVTLVLIALHASAPAAPAAPAVAPACPPLPWVTGDLGSGHWIISHTDQSWSDYMLFLNVSKAAWPAEFNASDIHQYTFFTNETGLFYIMNHTIPGSGFHLLFEADSNGKWAPNPYPHLTPAGFDPSSAKVNLKDVRYTFEKPGVPFDDSCWAWRTDMPIVKNVTKDGKVVPTEFVITFWRELTSPTVMRCTLYVTEAKSGAAIAPWSAAPVDPHYPAPSSRIPGSPQRLSYRYFGKTVQSFPDAAARHPCSPTGYKGDTHEFC